MQTSEHIYFRGQVHSSPNYATLPSSPPTGSLEARVGSQLPASAKAGVRTNALCGCAHRLPSLRPHSRSAPLPPTSREPVPQTWREETRKRRKKDLKKKKKRNASCTGVTYSFRSSPRLSSFIQLGRSVVPSGSPGAGSGRGCARRAAGAAAPRPGGEPGRRPAGRASRTAERRASLREDWPWRPMCLCLCGLRGCCQHAPKVSARQRASEAGRPIAAPPRSPDSWPALALVYFRPDVTSRADFKVGTILGSPW